MQKNMGGGAQALEKRLRRLYGQGDFQARILGFRRNRRRMLLGGCGVLLLALMIRAVAPMAGETLLETDHSGNVISIKRPATSEGPVTISLTAVVGQGETALAQPVTLSVVPEGNPESPGLSGAAQEPSAAQKSHMAVQKTVFQLGKDAVGTRLHLPDALEDGAPLTWLPAAKTSPVVFALLAALLFLLMAGNPERKLKQEEQAASRSIRRALPGFVNKIVLLMDSGMVLDASLRRISEGAGPDGKPIEDYFYGQLAEIARQCANTNSAMHLGLRDFALRSGFPEFIRLTNLISDSTKKGVDVMALLSMERESLWFARKKAAEQEGRMAETKLTLPLVILLLVLVMVTITPAMLEM